MTPGHEPVAASLLAWSAGSRPLEAAMQLLSAANNGGLLAGPWVRHDDRSRYWFDPEIADQESGYLSGGERRVLAIVTSLASSSYPVDLNDVMTGIDPSSFAHVIQALGHAYGLTDATTPTTQHVENGESK